MIMSINCKDSSIMQNKINTKVHSSLFYINKMPRDYEEQNLLYRKY